MFFLKELPSNQMIAGYAETHGVAADTIARGLSLMRNASVLIRRLESYFSDHGLSQLRFLFLIVIDREPERDTLTVGEITARLDVAGPVIARTLRALVADGLVESHSDDRDARTKHVRLTDRGRETLRTLLPGYFAIIADEMDKPE